MIGIPSQKKFQKQFFSQKHAYLAQLEALPFVKNDYKNVRHSELKLKILLNKAGTRNTYQPYTSNEIRFYGWSPKKNILPTIVF